jgi:hypothetical protein
MKYLLSYKIFESEYRDFDDWDKMDVDMKKSKLFSIYPAIPLEKRASDVAIRKIRIAEGEPVSKLEDNTINFPDKKLIDKLRWNEYFNSLISAKEIRGHNFEGLIAGLYEGEFTRRGERGDLKIGAEKKVVSVKSLNNKSESVVLGSIFKSLSDEQKEELKIKNEKGEVTGYRSISTVFAKDTRVKGEEDFRRSIWDAAFGGNNNVDYFLIAYFVEADNTKGTSGTIFIYIFTNEEMYDFIKLTGLGAPKKGESKFQVKISSTYKSQKNPISIKIPKITEEDLDKIWNAEARKWSDRVFGNKISRKMRTDTIEDIIGDKDNISKRMTED